MTSEFFSDLLELAKWCYKNPTKCKQELVCPALKDAKEISCEVEGCRKGGKYSNFTAHYRLRAAEACLATRDAIFMLCPLAATKKHQDPYIIERRQYENKARACQAQCGAMRIYPWGG